MTREALESLVREAIATSQADEVFITCFDGTTTSIPYARSTALQAVAVSGTTFQATARFDDRRATVSGGIDGPTSLAAALKQAEVLARMMAAPEVMVPAPAGYPFRPAPLAQPLPASTAEWLGEALREILGIARGARLQASGALSIQEQSILLASSRGLMAWQPSTMVKVSVQMMNDKATSLGLATDQAHTHTALDPRALARRAADKCLAWKNPREEKFDRITTVFEAPAFAELLMPFIAQFDHDAIRNNRSFLRKLDESTRIGSLMFSDDVTLACDPFNPTVPAASISPDGAEIVAQPWIDKGRIERAAKSPFNVARELGGRIEPPPSNLIVSGGTQSLDQLIAGMDRGLLVPECTSVRIEDPTNCLLNASTQGGLFMIRNGKISHAVKNMIIRETPVYLFLRKEAMGIPVRCHPRGTDFPMLVPPIRVKDVMYAGLSGIV